MGVINVTLLIYFVWCKFFKCLYAKKTFVKVKVTVGYMGEERGSKQAGIDPRSLFMLPYFTSMCVCVCAIVALKRINNFGLLCFVCKLLKWEVFLAMFPVFPESIIRYVSSSVTVKILRSFFSFVISLKYFIK